MQLGAHGLLLCLKSSLPLDLVNFTCIGLASVLTLDETLHGNILGETGILIWKDDCSYVLMAAFYYMLESRWPIRFVILHACDN